MWGHDFPHPEGAIGHTVEGLQANFAGFDDATTRMPLAGTAAQVYGFDLEALRPIAERVNITPSLVRQPLEEIPADSTCLSFQRARAQRMAAGA